LFESGAAEVDDEGELMRKTLNVLADRLVGLVVPKTTAGACACNSCEPECVPSTVCTTRCARVCRNCDCSRVLSRSCLTAAGCGYRC
jgi:hypothetical protein